VFGLRNLSWWQREKFRYYLFEIHCNAEFKINLLNLTYSQLVYQKENCPDRFKCWRKSKMMLPDSQKTCSNLQIQSYDLQGIQTRSLVLIGKSLYHLSYSGLVVVEWFLSIKINRCCEIKIIDQAKLAQQPTVGLGRPFGITRYVLLLLQGWFVRPSNVLPQLL
jgi:hypothetical protein